MAEKIEGSQLAARLSEVPLWRYDESAGSIIRQFSFKDFSEAFGFMTRVALAVQAADHHPDWSNSYGRVEITLSTHSAGGITDNDLALAKAIDALAG